MKKLFMIIVGLFTLFMSTENVSANTGTGNSFTEIQAFQTEEGPRLLLRYDYSGVLGAFNLQRAVGPDGTYMPTVEGEVVQMYFEGNTVVWILDLDKLGRQRTFRIVISD